MTLELYAPGELILQQGDDIHRALYIVTEGLVRLQEAESGRTVDMAGSGSQFGSYGLLQGGALPYEARAVQQTSCALIAADSFTRLVDSNEAFRAYFEADIQRYVRMLDEDIGREQARSSSSTPPWATCSGRSRRRCPSGPPSWRPPRPWPPRRPTPS